MTLVYYLLLSAFIITQVLVPRFLHYFSRAFALVVGALSLVSFFLHTHPMI
jgi:hypothetical protein